MNTVNILAQIQDQLPVISKIDKPIQTANFSGVKDGVKDIEALNTSQPTENFLRVVDLEKKS
jgi:hypothetical protein